jgi:hypothetical protein
MMNVEQWNENWQGKPKYQEKTCPSATFFTTNPIWPDLGSNPGRRGEKPATKRLSYGAAFKLWNFHLKTLSILVISVGSLTDKGFIHSSVALQPFVRPWPHLQFRNLFCTVGRTPWTGDQPLLKPLPKHRTIQTQNKRTHRHPCLEWDSNPRFQCSSERMLLEARRGKE